MTSRLDVPQMLQYWGTPFITILYRCFLNREPDPEGLKYYLARLTQGIDRLIIIEQFLKSKETKHYFTPQEIALLRLEIQRLKALHHSGFLPIARIFSDSLTKSQRIMLNHLKEVQFHLEPHSIPSRQSFFKKAKTSMSPQKLIFNNFESHCETLTSQEQTLFKKIYKQL